MILTSTTSATSTRNSDATTPAVAALPTPSAPPLGAHAEVAARRADQPAEHDRLEYGRDDVLQREDVQTFVEELAAGEGSADGLGEPAGGEGGLR